MDNCHKKIKEPIQLGVFKKSNRFEVSKVEDIGKVSFLKNEKGWTVVLLGDYKTYEEAKAIEKLAKQKVKKAFVVAIRNNKKIPIPKVH